MRLVELPDEGVKRRRAHESADCLPFRFRSAVLKSKKIVPERNEKRRYCLYGPGPVKTGRERERDENECDVNH